MTPYILEEREMRVTQMDIFSRLMRERLLWVAGPVNDRMSTVVQAQLMYLDSTDNLDITMHIDSPGGSVKSGLSMVDVMDYIKCDIEGYEWIVFQEIKDLIIQHRPIVQVEIAIILLFFTINLLVF